MNNRSFETIEYAPVVKNWFSRKAFEENNDTALYDDIGKDYWVLYNEKASITLSEVKGSVNNDGKT
jgi:hypothetical protein